MMVSHLSFLNNCIGSKTNMKTLGIKSISEIVATIVIIILSLSLILLIFMHYQFVFAQIVQAIKVVLYAVIIVALVSTLQLIVLLNKPKIILEYDEEQIYYHKHKKKVITVQFKDIQNIYTKVSIWTKPFVVYTAIVIITEEEVYHFRHISRMNEAKDVIQHIAYHEE